MKKGRPNAGFLVAAFVFAALLLFSIRGAVLAWRLAGPTKMSIHGYIAMAIAAVGVMALGGGLMWLAFYSSRAGFDDGQDDPHG